MTTLTIGAASSRYRLAPGHTADRDRLDRILTDDVAPRLDVDLADALHRAGVHPNDVVVIRRIDIAFTIPATPADSTLAAWWSTTVAEAIASALERGGSDVIRYRHLGEPLVELAEAVGGATDHHRWAWIELGLAPPGPPDRRADARALAAGLAARPAAAARVLASVAERHPVVLDHLADAELDQIATAVLGWFGAPAAILVGPASAGARVSPERAPSDPRPSDQAIRIGAASPLASTQAVRAPGPTNARRARSLAILAVADRDPAALTGDPDALGSLVRAVSALLQPDLAPVPKAAGQDAATQDPAMPAGAPETLVAPEPTRSIAADSETEPPRADEDVDGNRPRRANGAPTSWAGLLFVLNLVAPEHRSALMVDSTLAAALEAVAHRLIPVDPRDPAVAAFTGRALDDPDLGAPDLVSPRAADRRHQVADELRSRVEVLLGGEDAVERLCRRDALVTVDPGWIEIELALDEVDLGVRRAGLDLDPGWLPWLGAVVRFRYV